jgi:hypothetical protein
VLGHIHGKYIEGGQVGYKQSYSVDRSAFFIVDNKNIRSTVLHRMLAVHNVLSYGMKPWRYSLFWIGNDV